MENSGIVAGGGAGAKANSVCNNGGNKHTHSHTYTVARRINDKSRHGHCLYIGVYSRILSSVQLLPLVKDRQPLKATK